MSINQKIRDGKGGEIEVRTTPVKAIRYFCKECMGYQAAEVPRCTAPLCPLYPYRMGKSLTGRKGNPENLPHNRAKSEQGHDFTGGQVPMPLKP